jgi:hypothetical protein
MPRKRPYVLVAESEALDVKKFMDDNVLWRRYDMVIVKDEHYDQAYQTCQQMGHPIGDALVVDGQLVVEEGRIKKIPCVSFTEDKNENKNENVD